MALNTSTSMPPVGSPPYSIFGGWSIGDSLPYINANSNNFDSRIVTLENARVNLSTQVNAVSTEIFNANSVFQIPTITQTLPSKTGAGFSSTITDTGITPIVISRTTSTSKLIIELTGGVYTLTSGQSLTTYFYISLGTSPYADLLGHPVEYAIRTGGGNDNKPHNARASYLPSSNLPPGTQIGVKVYAKISNSSQFWHNATLNNIPITFSVTEIA